MRVAWTRSSAQRSTSAPVVWTTVEIAERPLEATQSQFAPAREPRPAPQFGDRDEGDGRVQLARGQDDTLALSYKPPGFLGLGQGASVSRLRT